MMAQTAGPITPMRAGSMGRAAAAVNSNAGNSSSKFSRSSPVQAVTDRRPRTSPPSPTKRKLGTRPVRMADMITAPPVLQGSRKPSALVDRALGVQFRRDIGAADHMHRHTARPQRIGQRRVRLLPGAQHDGVRLDQRGRLARRRQKLTCSPSASIAS